MELSLLRRGDGAKMKIKNDVETIYCCDGCGEVDIDQPEFSISIDYGGEDPCFMCGDEHDILGDYDHDIIYEHVSTTKYHYCEECRCWGDKNPGKKFEQDQREKRATFLKSWIEQNLIPGLGDVDKAKEDQIAKLKEKKEAILYEMKGGLSEFGYISKSEELVKVLGNIKKLEYVS